MCFELTPVRFILVLSFQEAEDSTDLDSDTDSPKEMKCCLCDEMFDTSEQSPKLPTGWRNAIADLVRSQIKPRAKSKLFRSLMQMFPSHPLSKRSAVDADDLIPLYCVPSVKPSPLSSNARSAMKRHNVKPVLTTTIGPKLKEVMHPDH